MNLSDSLPTTSMPVLGRAASKPDSTFEIRLAGALVLWLVVCATRVFVPWGGALATKVFGLFYDTPVGPILAFLCWRASRASASNPRVAHGWRTLAVAYTIYWIGNCIWNVYEGILEIKPFPSAADPFFLIFYPLAIYGLTSLTERLPNARDRLKFTLDCTTAVVSSLGILWYFALQHSTVDSEHGILGIIVSASYPIADVMLLIAVVSALLKRQTLGFSAPLITLACSYLAMMAADLSFMEPATDGDYASGGITDAFFQLSFALVAIAAALQLRAVSLRTGRVDVPAAYSFHLFPYVTVVAVFGLQLWVGREGWLQPTGILSFVAMATTVIVVLRQILATRENAELSAAQAAQAAEVRYKSLVRNSSDIVLVTDEKGCVSFITPSVERQLGLAADELLGTPLTDLTHPNDLYEVRHFCRDLSEDPSLTGPVEWRLRTPDGGYFYVEVVGSNLLADPNVRGLVLNARDITERKRLEDELKHLAFTDTLTLLANRNLFNEQLALALNRGEPYPTLIFVDLDNFKKVNDTLGHEAGDKLLAVAARRLIRTTRSGDTVARLGGDEFALLVAGDTTQLYVEALAARLVEALSTAYEINGRQLTLSASIGIAKGDRGMSSQELMRNADLAMYRAKARGKRCYEVYEPTMYANMRQSVDLEMELTAGLERGEFVPYFQPIVDLRTSEIVGVEALARWHHPERGVLSPAIFIQIAEDSGLIDRLGRSMLMQTCRHASEWLKTVKPERLQHIAINISGRQIEHVDLAAEVAEALKTYQLPPEILVLEITESVLMENVGAAIEQLDRLKALGVRIALDDFGTGYSSLSHVHRFPIDILKIDRSFVDALKTSDSSELVRAMISLAHALELDVVAEGIEKVEQLTHLQRLHCQHGQGFYFGRPETAETTRQLLRGTPRLPRLALVNTEASAIRIAGS